MNLDDHTDANVRGDVATSLYEYDARGYLVRVVKVTTADVERRKRFLAEHSLNESRTAAAGSNEEKRRELSFEYGARGYLSHIRCVGPRSDDHCTSTDQEFVVDSGGHIRRSIAPLMIDLLAPLDFSKPPDGHSSTARFETEFTYDPGSSSLNLRTYRNGTLFSEVVQIANDLGDVVLKVLPSVPGSPQTSYRYQYDKYQNWVKREVAESATITREISYSVGGK